MKKFKVVTPPSDDPKSKLGGDFFQDAGKGIFGDLWEESDITCKVNTWHISKIRTGISGSDRKSIVEEAILEALADGRIVARLSNNGTNFLNLIVEVWKENIPEEYRKALPNASPISLREVKLLVNEAMENSIFSDANISKILSKRRSRPGDDEIEYNSPAERRKTRSDDYRNAARRLLNLAIEELYWNTPTDITLYINQSTWLALLNDSANLDRKLKWVRSMIEIDGQDVDPDFVFRENKAKKPLIRGSAQFPASRVPQDRFDWDAIYDEALRRFDKHLVDTSPHEFRIMDPVKAVANVVDQAPWQEVSNWGPLSDTKYQSFWLVMTLATWRILACNSNVKLTYTQLIEQLEKFLTDQYELHRVKDKSINGKEEVRTLTDWGTRLPSRSVLGKIVRPVLAQFEQKSASSDIFNGLSVEYIKKEYGPRKPKNSTKNTPEK